MRGVRLLTERFGKLPDLVSPDGHIGILTAIVTGQLQVIPSIEHNLERTLIRGAVEIFVHYDHLGGKAAETVAIDRDALRHREGNRIEHLTVLIGFRLTVLIGHGLAVDDVAVRDDDLRIVERDILIDLPGSEILPVKGRLAQISLPLIGPVRTRCGRDRKLFRFPTRRGRGHSGISIKCLCILALRDVDELFAAFLEV